MLVYHNQNPREEIDCRYIRITGSGLVRIMVPVFILWTGGDNNAMSIIDTRVYHWPLGVYGYFIKICVTLSILWRFYVFSSCIFIVVTVSCVSLFFLRFCNLFNNHFSSVIFIILYKQYTKLSAESGQGSKIHENRQFYWKSSSLKKNRWNYFQHRSDLLKTTVITGL